MVKRLFPLALVVLALAAVPVAFGDDGSNPAPGPTGSTPTQTQTQGTQGRQGGNAKQRIQKVRARVHAVETRFAKHCGTTANGAPDRCVTFAKNVLAKLQALDARIQTQIQKLRACTATSTDRICKNADKKLAVLQKLDQRVQALEQKVQAYLNGTSTSSSTGSSSTSDSGLDQAAAGLGQLTQQVGGTTP
ncbi:MAG TPA: hypothetical protein VMJ49_07775 [Gaiellaceae bacterium]|nr:hypothetical protein [Gaiellaceae bacterium]